MSDTAKSCRFWAGEMHRAASAVEEASDGSPYAAQVIDGNRAIAETLTAAAEELDQHLVESEEVASAIERWKPLTDSLGAATNNLVNELDALRAEVERLTAERDQQVALITQLEADLARRGRHQIARVAKLLAEVERLTAELARARHVVSGCCPQSEAMAQERERTEAALRDHCASVRAMKPEARAIAEMQLRISGLWRDGKEATDA